MEMDFLSSAVFVWAEDKIRKTHFYHFHKNKAKYLKIKLSYVLSWPLGLYNKHS